MPTIPTTARSARSLPLAILFAAVLWLPSCGTDGGVSAFLPPGPPTQAPPGDKVLYVAMAAGDRIDAFRLGTDGLLPEYPFDTIFVDNPRRLLVVGDTLYATLFNRVVSMRLGDDGSLPTFPTSTTDPNSAFDGVDMVARDDMLYVASSGFGLVQSYAIEDDGDLSFLPTGSGEGQYSSDFLSLAMNGDYLYSGARDTQIIEVFLLEQDGRVPAAAEPAEPYDSISLPDDIEIRDDILYVTSASDRCIRAYRIDAAGFIGNDYDSRTKTEEYYSDILLAGDTLYATAYNAGRIDLYDVDANGMLPEEKPFVKTQGDPSSYPSQMVLDDGILYVAQAGHNRVDAYVLNQNGEPPAYPSSSTTPAPDVESLPLDLVLYQLD